jgi:hypothetical protein
MHPPAQSPRLGVSSTPRAARFSRPTEANTNSKEFGQSSPQKTNQQLAKRRDAQIETAKDRGTSEDRGTALLRENSTGRKWSCKWDDAPLAESFLPPVPNSARNALPRAHNDEQSRNQEIRTADGQLESSSEDGQKRVVLESHLLLGIGKHPSKAIWQPRNLSLEDGCVYIHVPLVDEQGHTTGEFQKTLLCELEHTCQISKVEDDPGAAGRCPSLLLCWGPVHDRVSLFLAGRYTEATKMVQWLIEINKIIRALAAEYHKKSEQVLRLYESRKNARFIFQRIRKCEDLEWKREREAQVIDVCVCVYIYRPTSVFLVLLSIANMLNIEHA